MVVNLKEHMRKMRERYEATGRGERLGFCPNCTNGGLVSMMWFFTKFDNGETWIGRTCAECGYRSWYHTDVLWGLVDKGLEAELRKARGPKPRPVELEIWHGAVLGLPSLERTFEG